MATEGRTEIEKLQGQNAFMRLLGLNFEEAGPERVVASFEANEDHHPPWGIVQGGVFTTVIETAARPALTSR